ncbi:relaxase/mobilization nuclease domain-containing protein [Brevundimonas bacteroides]|uniref:relaxase/mobilization nuclease domain-containing protein n=1 Tax=Brevundimonas bacteroides TaxID=74311 RepID=UPI0009FEECFD|nr:relaxase/mobilization nuclease domain-containing protein [Brevundimonas bacteroides]
MQVQAAIAARLEHREKEWPEAGTARLPSSVAARDAPVRTAMLQRLSASRLFARGDRSGGLRRAQARSGRAFRLDVRQRVIVKALVCRHRGRGRDRTAALGRHLAYLGRPGAGLEGATPVVFDREGDLASPGGIATAWRSDRHHFRFIVSPEHGDRLSDLRGYTRELMRRVADDLEEPALAWIAVCHFDTHQPHAHVLIRGRRSDARDLVIPRDYVAYGFRARAQELAQERLGDLSRTDAERRIWRETQAGRFTGFDRRLLHAADQDFRVDDAQGRSDAWGALQRGRLVYLEALGLATRCGRQFRLAPDLERRLRRLQIDRDLIRSFSARRLAGAREVQALGQGRVRGWVASSGHHDEMGASPYVFVRDAAGTEHYARLALGAATPRVGEEVEVSRTSRGLGAIVTRGRDLDASL